MGVGEQNSVGEKSLIPGGLWGCLDAGRGPCEWMTARTSTFNVL